MFNPNLLKPGIRRFLDEFPFFWDYVENPLDIEDVRVWRWKNDRFSPGPFLDQCSWLPDKMPIADSGPSGQMAKILLLNTEMEVIAVVGRYPHGFFNWRQPSTWFWTRKYEPVRRTLVKMGAEAEKVTMGALITWSTLHVYKLPSKVPNALAFMQEE